MYKLLLFFLQILILLIIVTFIFTNPFKISVDIENYKYTFSSNIFAIIALLAIIFLYSFFYIFFKSKSLMHNYFIKNKYKSLERGYLYFVEAMIALANKDNRNAIKFHKKMNSYIKDDPSLSLLLKSEVYKIERKKEELLEVYETMLKSKKTESLGYRGLMEQNLNYQDYHHAFLYGEKLFSLNPSIEKLYETLTYIIARTKNWNQLILISDRAYSKKIIDRQLLNENKSIGYYEIARMMLDSNIKEAIRNINKAVELRKNFPPFIKLHLELVAKSNNILLLKKLVKKYWFLNPNSLIREIITEILVLNKIDDLHFIKNLIKNNIENNESKKLLIYFAIKNEEWDIARDNIAGLIGANPTREICLFMSDIELGENSDIQKSDSWILRSESSIVENNWICKVTNQSQEEWNSLSDSGHFNSLVLSNSKMIDETVK